MITNIKRHLRYFRSASSPVETDAVQAYNLWSATYDQQPGNLMLDLDEIVFGNLINRIDLKNKTIADIGCGTGRHWPRILSGRPAHLRGYDVSAGMLEKLTEKFPGAAVIQVTDNLLTDLPDSSCDILISTLTIAHIADLEEALNAWSRVLKETSDILITDFHPNTLANGGKRTFRLSNQSVAVKNFVHPISGIKSLLKKTGFRLAHEEERYIDQSLKHYYTDQNALAVYEQFKGMPIIYGLHLKRGNGTE